MPTREDRDAMLAELETMPGYVRRAVERMGEAKARLPAPGDGFSLVEQVWHLADLEREGYGERLRRLVAEDDPFLPDFDGARLARERSYRARSLPEGLTAFAEARRRSLALLRALGPEAWGRRGRQEGVGTITLGDVARMMLEHDAGHREEIENLERALMSRSSG
jgi:DinB superfamily